MYNLLNPLPGRTLEKDVLPGQTVNIEGMCLVRLVSGGAEYMEPSNGSTGEDFAGFANLDNQVIGTEVWVEQKTVPASGTLLVSLERNNLTEVRIACNGKDTEPNAATSLAIVTSGAPAGNQVLVDYANGELTFNAGEKSKVATIYYRRTLSRVEAIQMYAQRNVNNTACDTFGRVGVICGHGQLSTDQYVINQNYAGITGGAGDDLRTGTTGYVTRGGNGDRVGMVIKLPTVSDPLLGMAFDTDSE
jgi:hypothetical protein